MSQFIFITDPGLTHIAFFAHIGGFITGIALGWLGKRVIRVPLAEMPDQSLSTQEKLMKAFNFTVDDLEYNRQGLLSPQQKRYFRRRLLGILVWNAVIIGCIVMILYPPTSQILFLGSFLLIPSAYSILSCLRNWWRIERNSLVLIEGNVFEFPEEPGATSQKKLKALDAVLDSFSPRYIIHVNMQTRGGSIKEIPINIRYPENNVFEADKKYRIYCLRRLTNDVISAEEAD